MPILSRPVEGISAEDVELLGDIDDDGGGSGRGEDDEDEDGLGPGAQVRCVGIPRAEHHIMCKRHIFQCGNSTHALFRVTTIQPMFCFPCLTHHQVRMTACWTSLKEVALVMGALAQEVPLPSGSSGVALTALPDANEDHDMGEADVDRGSLASGSAAEAEPTELRERESGGETGVVTASQLRRMGDLLLRLLLDVKHSGAVEKAAMGLGALAGRLLR